MGKREGVGWGGGTLVGGGVRWWGGTLVGGGWMLDTLRGTLGGGSTLAGGGGKLGPGGGVWLLT